MADTPIDERRFTDREVREILKKAVESAPSRSMVKAEGLSLAELKAIGEEVGIEPRRLEDAARSLVRGSGNRAHPVLGGATVLRFERKVEGEFDPADTPEVLSVVRGIMGRHGDADELHGSLEWKATGESGERHVTLSSRDGTTTIRGSANLANSAVGVFLGGGSLGLTALLIGFATFVKSGNPVGLLVAFAVLAVVYPVLRTIFAKISEKESGKLQHVVDELARLTEGSRS